MGKTILYIEDNPDNMMLVKRALEARGYILLEAFNGVKGVETAEGRDVDLVLLDINLPDIDGYEVARRLRGNQKSSLAYVPIIAITANALKGDAEKALAAGCDVYMSKPINIRELWARVEAFVPAPDPRVIYPAQDSQPGTAA
jgi:CheY-like chemotaxis protein